MSFSVQILHEDNCRNLAKRFPVFSFLEKSRVPFSERFLWERNERITRSVDCIFLGKTGYGKSTTLNALVGKNVFKTSDTTACTDKLFCADFLISPKANTWFSLGDLPGVGENITKDKKYIQWYSMYLSSCAAAVYILRADQRDFSVDLNVLNKVIKITGIPLLIGLNYCDKIEPVNRQIPFAPTDQQQKNIIAKQKIIAEIFKLPTGDIVPFSAAADWNIDFLAKGIARKIRAAFRTNLAEKY
ncbi:MAG: hypothetical protein AMXMBFR48_14550 [Ignavibacteriales bacterium]